MAIGATAASGWPQKFAYLSAAIFTAASGGTNLIYGWQKGGDLPSSCVWAGVSAGVAIIFALSWPALIKSLEAKRWSGALIALVALGLAGAYSVTAALGSAAGGRTNAAAAEKDTRDTRKKAQAAYDKAQAELEALKPSRPVAELEALVEGAKPQCRVVVTNGGRETVCTKPPALTAELRAREREKLTAKLESASAELKATGPTKVANSDAKALQRYLAAVGVEIGAERLNDLLVLFAVVMIEAGGGLSPGGRHGPQRTAGRSPVRRFGHDGRPPRPRRTPAGGREFGDCEPGPTRVVRAPPPRHVRTVRCGRCAVGRCGRAGRCRPCLAARSRRTKRSVGRGRR